LPKIQQNRAVKTGEIGGLYLLKVLYKINGAKFLLNFCPIM
jgi:hypothetical protein